ncbi:hypothetical protein CPB85DRAFT_1319795 [Mucidula mucida]|nr:hypothetical protein CPB85DRAFT_1319795 [Mucidula mucida]
MVLDFTQGAWAASRVCRSWRSASRHPHLWTNFRITSGCTGGGSFSHRRPTFIRYKNPIAILQTALRYSESCKLDWHVEIRFDDCIGNRRRIHSLLDVLMSHSERWACVSLTIPSELGKYLERVRGKVPELRRLTFVGCDPESSWEAWEPDDAPLIRAFAIAPKLRRVSVENALLLLTYSRLTSFTAKFNLYFPDVIPPLFVIKHCVRLRYMEANIVGRINHHHFEVDTTKPSVLNTSLKHLTINDPALLAYLSLPALLSLDIGDIGRLSCLSFITPFLDISQCSLTRLYFRDSAFSGAPLADILSLVPGLTDLGIGFHTDSDAIARQLGRIDLVLAELIKSLLVVDGKQHRLVPRLKHFDFMSRIYWADCQFVGPALVNMLHSRKRTMLRASFRWAAPRVVRFPNLSHACFVALHKMKEKGLDITICALDHVGGSVL